MKFILTQHTETEWNRTGRRTGRKDIGLNTQGKLDAALLAKTLSGQNINFIVTSDLLRAKQTAEIVNDLLKLPLELEPKLRECSFGSLEGLTKPQAIDKHGNKADVNWDNNPAYNFTPFGARA